MAFGGGIMKNLLLTILAFSLMTCIAHAGNSYHRGNWNVSGAVTSEAGELVGTQTALDLKADDADLSTHTGNTSDPHSVTAAQVGLGSANDTSDTDKPISDDTQTALDLKADAADVSNIDNTSDDAKPVSTAQQTALDLKADILNVLELDNAGSFTPDADYEPATKKYVDDNAGSGTPATFPHITGDQDITIFNRTFHYFDGAYTATMDPVASFPSAGVNSNGCFTNSAGDNIIKVCADGDDYISLDGEIGNDGECITTPTKGASVCMGYLGTEGWYAWASVGWTSVSSGTYTYYGFPTVAGDPTGQEIGTIQPYGANTPGDDRVYTTKDTITADCIAYAINIYLHTIPTSSELYACLYKDTTLIGKVDISGETTPTAWTGYNQLIVEGGESLSLVTTDDVYIGGCIGGTSTAEYFGEDDGSAEDLHFDDTSWTSGPISPATWSVSGTANGLAAVLQCEN
jgi:hypothetical protein